jgi:hypothetical protein
MATECESCYPADGERDIHVACIVIPDGVNQPEGRKPTLRCSIMLTPFMLCAGDPMKNRLPTVSPTSVPMQDWPGQIMSKMAGGRLALRLWWESVDPSRPGPATADLVDERIGKGDYVKEKAVAEKMWRQAFADDPRAWDALYDVLRDESMGRVAAHDVATRGAANGRIEVTLAQKRTLHVTGTISPDTRALGQAVRNLMNAEIAAHLHGSYLKSKNKATSNVSGPRWQFHLVNDWLTRVDSAMKESKQADAANQTQPNDQKGKKGANAAAHNELGSPTSKRRADTAFRIITAINDGKGMSEGQFTANRANVPQTSAVLVDGLTELTFSQLMLLARRPSSDRIRDAVPPRVADSLVEAAHDMKSALRFERTPAGQFDRQALKPPPTCEELKDAARRRIAGIRSMPTLGKLFRLLIDIEVDVPDAWLPILTQTGRPASKVLGRVCAQLVDPVLDPLPEPTTAKPAPAAGWTNFLLSTYPSLVDPDKPDIPQKPRGYFAPASRVECRTCQAPTVSSASNATSASNASGSPGDAPDAAQTPVSLPLQWGIAQLQGHYELRSIDASLSFIAMEGRARAWLTQMKEGQRQSQVSDHLGHFLSQGIQLIDTDAATHALTDLCRSVWYTTGRSMPTAAVVTATADDPSIPWCAEDLVVGYRVDIQRSRRIARPGRLDVAWHPATARSVTYDGVSDRNNVPLYTDLSAREEGSVRTLTRLLNQGETDDDSKVIAALSQEMFTWTGAPLGFPMPRNTAFSSIPLDPHRDLNVGVSYGFPAKRMESGRVVPTLPALRIGDSYRMVLRACYLNGGGPPDETEHLNANGDSEWSKFYTASAVGSTSSGDPYSYRVAQVTGAPELCLPSDDRLVSAAAPEQVSPGEDLHRIVLRVEPSEQRDVVVRRVVLPPQVPFDLAEAQGQFDDATVAGRPPGALRQIDMNGQPPVLPTAVDGGVLDASPGDGVNAPTQPVKSRGPVIRARVSRHERTRGEFYCDRRGQYLVLTFPQPMGGLSGNSWVYLPFWTDSERPRDAMPVMLEFAVDPDLASGVRIHPFVVDRFSSGKLKGLSVRRQRIDVALAEDLELLLWCPDVDAAINNVFVAETLSQLLKDAGKGGRPGQGDAALMSDIAGWISPLLPPSKRGTTIGKEFERYADHSMTPLTATLAWQGSAPIDVINGLTRLRVTAAVKQPLARPSFVSKIDANGCYQMSLRLIRLNTHDAATRWSSYVAKGAPGSPLSVGDEPGGQIGFLDAQARFDAKSTGTLRGSIVWDDCDEKVALSYDSKIRRWMYEPRKTIHELFADTQIGADSGSEIFDLTRDANGNARGISCSLGTVARRVGVRLVAGSRFADCFVDSDKPKQPGKVGRDENSDLSFNEIESTPQVSLLNPASGPGEFGLRTLDTSFWVEATERPPALNIDGVELVPLQIPGDGNEQGWRVRCRQQVRIWFTRGTCFQSGEGELVGVVCMPMNHAANSPARGYSRNPSLRQDAGASDPSSTAGLCALPPLSDGARHKALAMSKLNVAPSRNDALSALAAEVTAVGADPTSDGGAVPQSISLHQFRANERIVLVVRTGLTLPLAPTSDAGADQKDTTVAPEKVDVVAYEPLFDAVSGRRYIEIDFSPPPVDGVFITFALSRYQPNALILESGQDLCLSSTVRLDAIRLHPERCVSVLRDVDGGIHVKIDGPAYWKRSPCAPLTGYQKLDDALAKALKETHLDSPAMCISLRRRVPESDAAGILIHTPDGKPAEKTVFNQRYEGLGHDGRGVWEACFARPVDVPVSELVLHVEEFEFQPSVAYNTAVDKTRDFIVRCPRPFKCEVRLADGLVVAATPSVVPE